MMQNDSFKKVALSTTKEIFKDICTKKSVLLVKGELDELVQLIPMQVTENPYTLNCFLVPESPATHGIHEVIVNFGLDEDRYFFHTCMTVAPNKITIELNADLFMLQRRRAPRMIFPEDYQAFYHIQQINGHDIKLNVNILDFSSGGCRASTDFTGVLFQPDDSIKGILQIGKRMPVAISAVVRHSYKMGDDPQVFGLQFYPVDRLLEGRLMTLFMDIQREIFIKYKNHPGVKGSN